MEDNKLLPECSQTVNIKDFKVVIKHNDVGISIDIYHNLPLDKILVREQQYWFEDLENDFLEDANQS